MGHLRCSLHLLMTVYAATVIAGDDTGVLDAAHGITASIAWVIFFPVGAILLRLIRNHNAWWIHASIQGLTIILVTASVGTGIVLAQNTDQLNSYHPIIGLVLFSMVFFQAAGGILHHLFYRKQHRRTFISHLHIWLGRTIITIGMINGGLGLLLAGEGNGKTIAYGVISGIIWIIFVVVAITSGRKPPESHLEVKTESQYADSREPRNF